MPKCRPEQPFEFLMVILIDDNIPTLDDGDASAKIDNLFYEVNLHRFIIEEEFFLK